jgi:SAM-dependent methyltransferase
MMTQTIRRQYDEVIAHHYDQDPQAVLRTSLDRAADQIRQHLPLSGERLRVLDVGVGTGLFLARLRALGGPRVEPFGLDLSEKMIAIARRRMPDLVAAVDDAANLDAHFPGRSFDLVCSHFITGFVPLAVLAPRIRERLAPGGYWSLVGGTMAGFPALRARANAKSLRWLFRGRTLDIDELACNPAGLDEVVQTLQANGLEVCAGETFEPALSFRNFQEFMDFAYRGGWLTPFIEALGLHRAKALTRLLLNLFVFPAHDHHSIAVVLARKSEHRG